MYGVKENKCLEEIAICRFQDTMDIDGSTRETKIYHNDKITAESAVIVSFSGAYHSGVKFEATVGNGTALVTVVYDGENSFPITYNVTVI